jgi:hypothetical protein
MSLASLGTLALTSLAISNEDFCSVCSGDNRGNELPAAGGSGTGGM